MFTLNFHFNDSPFPVRRFWIPVPVSVQIKTIKTRSVYFRELLLHRSVRPCALISQSILQTESYRYVGEPVLNAA